MTKKLKNTHKPVDMLSKVDRDWEPPYKTEKELASQSSTSPISDINFSDINSCPICQKSFSRGAALICHVKQLHSYTLSDPNETNVDALKIQVVEWTNRKKKKEVSLSPGNEDIVKSEVETSSSPKKKGNVKNGLGKSSSPNKKDRVENGVLNYWKRKADPNVEESNKPVNEDDDDDDACSIIGGSVLSNGELRKGELKTAVSFHEAEDELLDPDQSFAIVRNGKKRQSNNTKKMEVKKNSQPNITSKSPKEVDSKSSKYLSDAGKSLNSSKKIFVSGKRIFNSEQRSPSKNSPLKVFANLDFSVDNNAPRTKLHSCPICSMRFSNSTLFTYHQMRVHMKDELQQCPKCAKCFYSSRSYADHLETHL